MTTPNDGYRQGLEAGRAECEKRIAAFKELMDCGHPRACWIEELCRTPECPIKDHGHCIACERQRLEVAAALERVAHNFDNLYWTLKNKEAAQAVRGMIPAADGSLLDARDAEIADLKRQLAGRPTVFKASPICLDCNKAGLRNCSHFDNCDGVWIYHGHDDAYIRKKVDEARLDEARRWQRQQFGVGYSSDSRIVELERLVANQSKVSK